MSPDSIERMLRKNPLQLSRIFNFQPGGSIYARVETLMNSDNGLIGLAWASLREAWFSEHAERLIVIQPGLIMKKLHEELRQPAFEHGREREIQ